jgi:hypothetical protein
VKGLGSEDSMSTYYKYFRLACERATGGKIFDSNKGLDRKAYRVTHIIFLFFLSIITYLSSRYYGSYQKSTASLDRSARKGPYMSRTSW